MKSVDFFSRINRLIWVKTWYSVCSRINYKQECIPVGCVLSTAVAVTGVCLPQCMLGYVCPGEDVCPSACWDMSAGVSAPVHAGLGLPLDVSASVHAGICLSRGVSAPVHAGIHPCCEQNDWQTGVKTLPCCNYVADGNNDMKQAHQMFIYYCTQTKFWAR